LLVIGAAPALAKGTTSIEPADKAVTAIAAKPKALVLWAQNKARCRHKVKTPLQEGKGELDALPLQGERMVKAMLLQGKANHEVETSLRRAQVRNAPMHCHQRASVKAAQHHKAQPNAKSRYCHKKESTKAMSYHMRCCHKSASDTQTRANTNPFSCKERQCLEIRA